MSALKRGDYEVKRREANLSITKSGGEVTITVSPGVDAELLAASICLLSQHLADELSERKDELMIEPTAHVH